MIKLTDWYFTKGLDRKSKVERFLAEGFVSNHPKLTDGVHIHTSIIDRLELDAENNRLLMYTHSQHTYELLLADMKLEDFENIQDCLEYFNVPALSLSECQKIKDDSEKNLISMVDEILQKNELYLLINGVFIQQAFFKNNANEVREIKVKAHISMFQDSYIINDYIRGDVDFRYWDGQKSITPYHWSDGLDAILISNKGSQDIDFIGSERTIICKVGEITRIESTEFVGEGLLSPDAVNGKCVFYSGKER